MVYSPSLLLESGGGLQPRHFSESGGGLGEDVKVWDCLNCEMGLAWLVDVSLMSGGEGGARVAGVVAWVVLTSGLGPGC